MWKAGGGLDQSRAACTLQSARESEEDQCQGPTETSEIRTSETRILENPSTHSQGWEERTQKPESVPCKWDRSHWAIETVTRNPPPQILSPELFPLGRAASARLPPPTAHTRATCGCWNCLPGTPGLECFYVSLWGFCTHAPAFQPDSGSPE